MHELSAVLVFCGISLLVIALLSLIRFLALKRMSVLLTAASGETPELRPAELAYLLRRGDMTHTITVIAVDILQRSLKSPGGKSTGQDEGLVLQPYESAIWSKIKDFSGRFARDRISEVVPVAAPTGLLEWLSRIKAVKTFLTGTLLAAIRDLIKDPRNLRKYFSVAGIYQLAVDLYSSGYKNIVEMELKQELLSRGLLVSETRRRACARALAFLALLSLFLVSALFFFLLPGLNYLLPLWLCLMGLFNASLIKAVLFLPSLLPAYEEFLSVISEMERGGFRFAALRNIFGAARLLLFLAVFFLSLLAGAGDLTICHLALALPLLPATALLLVFTALGFLVVQLLADCHALYCQEFPGLTALGAIKAVKQRIRATSPLQSLKQVLSDDSYDPAFSEIVAIYGIETLWLLS